MSSNVSRTVLVVSMRFEADFIQHKQPLIRPRRASRAPPRLVDENNTVAPRLLSKGSLASMSATGKPNKIVGTAVSATATKLTAGVSLALNGTRKALGDVSNAARVRPFVDILHQDTES